MIIMQSAYEVTNIYKDWINQYYEIVENLDERAAKILEIISIKNTTNLSKIAKILNLPNSTVYNIVTKLREKNLLSIRAIINTMALGLKPYSVILYHTSNKNAERILQANKDYWTYAAKGRTDRPCFYVKYVIPDKHEKDFIEFLETALQLNLISDYEAYPITATYDPPLSFKNFNFQTKIWSFNWYEFLDSIRNITLISNERLISSNISRQKLDKIDLRILKNLEINAFTDLRPIQRSLKNVTFQTVYYHYINHIIKKGLINNFRIVSIPYPYSINGKIVVDSMIIFITFKDQEWLFKFASMLNGIFARGVTRIPGKNILVFDIRLPHVETHEFFNMLDTMIEEGIITSYRCIWLDLRTGKTETLPYEKYDTRTGTWRWYQEEYLLNLQKSLEETKYSVVT
ncbi:MAG: helix-turn-helix domain-containing protein [Thermoprotei archaeon]